jgi:hypothetical protein
METEELLRELKSAISKRNKRLYYKNTTYNKPREQKRLMIKTWKRFKHPVITDFDVIYDIYINTHKCDFCKKTFKDSFDRCLDHCHMSGSPRGILCRSCNTLDVLDDDYFKKKKISKKKKFI